MKAVAQQMHIRSGRESSLLEHFLWISWIDNNNDKMHEFHVFRFFENFVWSRCQFGAERRIFGQCEMTSKPFFAKQKTENRNFSLY